MSNFPDIGYTELNENIFNALQNKIPKLKNHNYQSFLSKNTKNKKYISWTLNKYSSFNEDFNSYYFCNTSLRQYYSLTELNLTTKIFELW